MLAVWLLVDVGLYTQTPTPLGARILPYSWLNLLDFADVRFSDTASGSNTLSGHAKGHLLQQKHGLVAALSICLALHVHEYAVLGSTSRKSLGW